MNRARLIVAATLVGACTATAAFAQTAPPMSPVLAGKKFTPPLKGAADVEFLKPETKRDKEMVITKIKVRNASNAPIARLTIAETWYDKGGATVGGGKGVINGLLQPGEVQTITIETPFKTGMLSNNYNFSHANGTVPKPHRVDKFASGDAPAAPAAPAAKKK
jgi:hypothetical protein